MNVGSIKLILKKYLGSPLEKLKHPPSQQWPRLCLQSHTITMPFQLLHSLRKQSPCSLELPKMTKELHILIKDLGPTYEKVFFSKRFLLTKKHLKWGFTSCFRQFWEGSLGRIEWTFALNFRNGLSKFLSTFGSSPWNRLRQNHVVLLLFFSYVFVFVILVVVGLGAHNAFPLPQETKIPSCSY